MTPPTTIPSPQRCPFEPGATYVVLQSFVAMRDTFVEGEVLVFDRDAWSRYDGITGYFFTDAHGHGRAWDIHDHEETAIWAQYFARR